MSGRRRRASEEEHEEDEERGEDSQPARAEGRDDEDENTEDEAPRQRSRVRRAVSSRRAADGDDDDDGDDGEDDDEDEDIEGRRGRRKRASSAGKQRAAPKRQRRSGGGATQSFCTSQVETDFAFTQAGVESFVARSQGKDDPLRQQDQTAYENLGATEKKLLLSSLIRYIVLKGSRKEPITRLKLNSDVVNKLQISRRNVLNGALKDAKETLRQVFGYELLQLPERQFNKAGMKDCMFLVSALRVPGLQRDLHSYGKDVGYRGLIMIVLGLIFCAHDKIREKVLYEQLQGLEPQLQITAKGGSKDGEYSISGEVQGVGEVSEAFEKMRKEQYLLREKEESDEGHYFVYSMGPRAYVEIGRRQVLQFLAETMSQEVDQSLLKEIENDEARQAEKEAEEMEAGG